MEWDKIVTAIQRIIEEIRKENGIENVIIRDDVFEILEKSCIVLYYPINDKKNCGFHIKKIVNNELRDFVYINTEQPLETQVFTAAHELGHIWDVAKKVQNILNQKSDFDLDAVEAITNRFAAELLMPTVAFCGRLHRNMRALNISMGEISMDDYIKLATIQMSDFLVPYVSVRKRLFETGNIDESTNTFLKAHEDEIEDQVLRYSKTQNSRLNNRTRSKTIPGIRSLVAEAEQKGDVDEFTIGKIKRDFEIENIETQDAVLIMKTEENKNGKDGSDD